MPRIWVLVTTIVWNMVELYDEDQSCINFFVMKAGWFGPIAGLGEFCDSYTC